MAQENSSAWKGFIRSHWKIFSAFVAAAVALFAGAVYVFIWFSGYAVESMLSPPTLMYWSMNDIVYFMLYLILWEVTLIGIPAAITGIAAWQWWKRLPETEKSIHTGRGSKGSRAGGAIGPLLFIAFALKVYLDGNWTKAISTFDFDYVVGSMITILTWIVAIFAIPAVVVLVWWVSSGRKKQPQIPQSN